MFIGSYLTIAGASITVGPFLAVCFSIYITLAILNCMEIVFGYNSISHCIQQGKFITLIFAIIGFGGPVGIFYSTNFKLGKCIQGQ